MNTKKQVAGYKYLSYGSALNGVTNWLQLNYPNLVSVDDNKYFTRVNTLMKEFLESVGSKYRIKNKWGDLTHNANRVQNRWNKFVNFVKNKQHELENSHP